MSISKRPLISIVTISFNQKKYLKQCLNSVITQLEDDIEYIVVDPGSSDGSRELIDSYGSSIKSVYQPDSGPADGLNNGFKVASGLYYYFLNSDDYLLSDAITNMKSVINSQVKSDVFCFGGYMVNSKSFHLRPMKTFSFSASRFCKGSTSIFQQGLLFSAQKFHEVGGFNKNNRTCWDAKLMFDISQSEGTFIDIDKKIACFRIHEDSITGGANNLIENQQNKDEMFLTHFGRNRNRFDKIIYHALRFMKYTDLKYTFETIFLKFKRF